MKVTRKKIEPVLKASFFVLIVLAIRHAFSSTILLA